MKISSSSQPPSNSTASTRPSAARSSTASSKARIQCNWVSMVPSRAGSACCQSFASTVSCRQGAWGSSGW
ncbi:hypothetical protein G6F66_015556 [Rhizopus arrhizus]|nr:hypothetical protein G6F66_015556 [Rhizopus arrhizus]